MVLIASWGAGADGAGSSGTRRAGFCGPVCPAERGSQTLELALAVPLVVLLLTLLLHAGLLGADLVAAQGIALQAARVAALADDAAVREAIGAASGSRPVTVAVHPQAAARVAGRPVTVVVHLESRAFAAFGVHPRLPGRATLLVEQP